MPALAELRRKHPLVRLVVSEALDSQMDEGLSGGLFDLAIRYLQASSVRREDRVLQHVATYLVGRQGDGLLRGRDQIVLGVPTLPRRRNVNRFLEERSDERIGFVEDRQRSKAAVMKQSFERVLAAGDALGTAGYFRISRAGSPTECDIQGTVTATGGGGDLTLATTSITSGLSVDITGGTITEAP